MYIHTCTYIYIYMSAHIHIYTYIHTHIQIVYMHARKHVWNDGAAATAREAPLDAKKLRPSPCPLKSGGGLPFVASSPIAHPRGTTDKRRTTTTNSSSSHHHDSAPSSPHPLICTGAEPIHPVHSPPKLPAWLWPPETRSFFCHFGGWVISIFLFYQCTNTKDVDPLQKVLYNAGMQGLHHVSHLSRALLEALSTCNDSTHTCFFLPCVLPCFMKLMWGNRFFVCLLGGECPT